MCKVFRGFSILGTSTRLLSAFMLNGSFMSREQATERIGAFYALIFLFLPMNRNSGASIVWRVVDRLWNQIEATIIRKGF